MTARNAAILLHQQRRLLKARRLMAKGVTQKEAARQVGWTRQWLSRLLGELQQQRAG